MTADFIAYATISTDDTAARIAWRQTEVQAMRDQGAQFFRWSHPEDKPDHLWLEGWLERPADQGPHPWETSNG